MAPDASDASDRTFHRVWVWVGIPCAFLIGGVLGALGHSVWPVPLDAIVKWGYAFSTSAGLGGMAALVAAAIAYRGVTRSAQTARDTALNSANTARKTALEAQWWENARWAADRLLSVSGTKEEDGSGVEEGESEVVEDASTDLLSDQDAYAAIITLRHLGENAPSDETSAFAQAVLGVALGVDSEESSSADYLPEHQENGNSGGEEDLPVSDSGPVREK